MKFSESWLREYVDPSMTTQELVDQLTMAGLEVDGFDPVAAEFSDVVVGGLEVSQHPDADKLVVCKVSSGDEEHQVVCGAPNARQGIKVPFALVGAKLEDLKSKRLSYGGLSLWRACSESYRLVTTMVCSNCQKTHLQVKTFANTYRWRLDCRFGSHSEPK